MSVGVHVDGMIFATEYEGDAVYMRGIGSHSEWLVTACLLVNIYRL